ncbi:hypothetical protein MW290_24665 [Aquincola tertiaricarbonis]|uniref:Uncharacterized protein n=1 Tax=Aquincola tertiaricarbonis TaxID=391953 RepID=A0ABY4S703_AQUTE|nr:hypothetical protein [Aquincola tertiaricarbonis]URI08773.1 hypothetical protein MW290_24665 [Aquincola tertiaricarbonis]
MTIPTNKPVPSSDPRDLLFNAEKLDEVVSSSADTYTDRFGVLRRTLAGIKNLVVQAIDIVLAGAGYVGYTVVTGDGVADNSTDIAAADLLGRPIMFSGLIVVASPTTITSPIVDTSRQIFVEGAQVTIANGRPVRPEWFGSDAAALDRAARSLSGGGTVQLSAASYGPCGHTYGASGAGSGKYLGIDNLRIVGAGMPRLSDDCKSLVGGSIIKGTFWLYANNIELRDVGVDCGLTVTDALYAGGPADALMISYPDTDAKAAAALRRGVKLHNVIGLARSPDALCHAVIAGEGVVEVVTSGDVVGCMGLHGVVIKASSIRADQLTAYCNNGEGVIIKSDAQATAVSSDVQIDRVTVRGEGPFRASPHAVATAGDSLQFFALGGAIDKVQIGEAILSGHPKGLRALFGGNYTIRGVRIGRLSIDQYSVSGTRQAIDISASGSQYVRGWSIGSIEARNTDVGLLTDFVQDSNTQNHVSIGHLEVTNATRAADVGSQSYVNIGAVVANGCSDAVYKITGSPLLKVGTLSKDVATPAVYSTSGGGLVPALSNGWTVVAGGDAFGVDLLGGKVSLRGLVKPGTGSTLTTLPRWAWPPAAKRLSARGRAGSAEASVPLLISTAGVVSVNEAAGGTANCTDWLSLAGIEYDLQG